MAVLATRMLVLLGLLLLCWAELMTFAGDIYDRMGWDLFPILPPLFGAAATFILLIGFLGFLPEGPNIGILLDVTLSRSWYLN